MDGASLVAASMFCNIAAALDGHVSEARRRGWCLPTQIVAGTSSAPETLTPHPSALPAIVFPPHVRCAWHYVQI